MLFNRKILREVLQKKVIKLIKQIEKLKVRIKKVRD